MNILDILDRLKRITPQLFLLLALTACSQKQQPVELREESRQAKQLLQGVWADSETDDIVFKMQGDSVYYPDSTSQPAYFKVVDDTLFIGTASYPIVKHAQHLLWFKGQDGDVRKLTKSDDAEADEKVFEKNKPQILTLTKVLKRDTVVMYNGERYHLYVAINPTKYRV